MNEDLEKLIDKALAKGWELLHETAGAPDSYVLVPPPNHVARYWCAKWTAVTYREFETVNVPEYIHKFIKGDSDGSGSSTV